MNNSPLFVQNFIDFLWIEEAVQSVAWVPGHVRTSTPQAQSCSIRLPIKLSLIGWQSSLEEDLMLIITPMGLEQPIPPVSTPFLPGCEKKKGKWGTKSCFDEAENRSASRHWVSGHRYTSFKCVSKLLWVWSDLKSDFFPEKNLLKSI